jgi:hypothetical protein
MNVLETGPLFIPITKYGIAEKYIHLDEYPETNEYILKPLEYNDQAREFRYRDSYTLYLKQLSQDAPLTESEAIRVISKYSANSAGRTKAYIAMNALLNYAGIKHGLKQYRTSYKPKVERTLPSDDELIQIIETIPYRWRWTVAMLATYGLRGHELKDLDCSKMELAPHIVYVNKDTKTGTRAVYPVPPQWVSRWQLWNVVPPPINEYPTKYEYGKSLNLHAKRIVLRHTKVNLTMYYLRDAYAVRCSLMGIDAAIAAKWMGHSLKVHWDSYLKFFDERNHKQAWEKLLNND